MSAAHVSIHQAGGNPTPACEAILRSLPDWFGIEESLLMYARRAAELPTWFAFDAGTSEPIAFITIARHFPESADVFCIAVRPEWHGRRVGHRLLETVEPVLRADGVRLLQVKTMGPSKPCSAYAMTLKFYRATGFIPLEELHGLWPGVPCLVLVKVLRAAS